MAADENIPDDALESMWLLIEVVKGYLKWVAAVIAIFAVLIQSKVWPRRVSLIAQNPMYVVHGAKFEQSLLAEVSNKTVNALIVPSLNKSLGVKLGEMHDDHIVFFRGNTITGQDRRIRLAMEADEYSWRNALKERKQFLGYDDQDARFQGARMLASWEHIYSLQEVLSDSYKLFRELELQYYGFGDGNFHIMMHDPFYSDVEKLRGPEKEVVYRCIAQASEVYSAFIIENRGNDSEYDLRITATVDRDCIDTSVWKRVSIYLEEAVQDSLRLLIPYLQSGPNGYKILSFRGAGPWTKPVREDQVKLYDKPLVQEVSEYLPWLLLFALIPTAVAARVNFLRMKRNQRNENLMQF